MTQVSTAARPAKSANLRLLVELEPWHKVFSRNLRDLFRRAPKWHGSCPPGRFWPDVFVSSRLPLWGLSESAFYHVIVVGLLWAISHFAVLKAQRLQPVRFQAADVVTYAASEYLPALNTMPASRTSRRGDPKYAKQEIISVPREADNTHQTIVTPPDIKLKQDVPMPNIVAWSHTPVAVPLAATAKTAADMKIPEIALNVVAPPPDARLADSLRTAERLAPAVIEPPPSVESASLRKIGDLNVGHSEVVAPAPQLPMGEQGTLRTRAAISEMAGPSVVAPPPAVERGSGMRGGGELIALNAEVTAPALPAQPPAGNRRGTFAAGSEGKATGSGAPDLNRSGGVETGTGQNSPAENRSLPSGLYVGKAPFSSAGVGNGHGPGTAGTFANTASNIIASAVPPRVTVNPAQGAEAVPPDLTMPMDRKVFGDRKIYAMTQNMPNLNSAGGSWVIRFAELKQGELPGQLVPPVAVRKVDPAYPVELMKNNVEGTVTLYAIIHSDGKVSTVRILDGPDDRLNAYASQALSRWEFQPAVKNGEPIAIEAVIRVPFKPRRTRSGF
ncbi:MAG TPA: energy transducer TonB [Terriglobales bacterium]|nr:energy transducer TonB [Terriglobales bacterium]